MELLLNTIWLVVAISSFRFWRPEQFAVSPADRGRTRSFGILALACALILLFPVVSLTDDLHAEQYPIEDSSRSVTKARNLEQGCLRAGRSPFMPALTSPPYSQAGLKLVLGLVILLQIRPYFMTAARSQPGRSPPFNS